MNEKILIIDDEKDLVENIILLLKFKGYNVFSAENGKEGIKLAKLLLPDLIICDIMMPDINGYEVLKELNNDEKTSLIPFIFLTCKVDRPEIRAGMDLGADDYLFKPFKPDELLASIQARLKRQEKFYTALHDKIPATVNEIKDHLNDTLIFKVKDSSVFVKIEEIIYISVKNQYTYVFMNEERYLEVRKSLNEWENILPGNVFVRIHRNAIVNINHIKNIHKSSTGSYKVLITNSSKEFEISVRYFTKLRKSFPYIFSQ